MAYTMSATRYFLDAGSPASVESAKAWPMKKDELVDEAMEACMRFNMDNGQVESSIKTDMNQAFMGHVVLKIWQVPLVRIEVEDTTIYYHR